MKKLGILIALWWIPFLGTTQIFIDNPIDVPGDFEKAIEWDGPDAFQQTEVPEKWMNESAVVLAVKLQDYISKARFDYYKRYQIYRFRVKLLDKAAVENFSTFYYTDQDIVGMRVYKEDGSVREVEVDGVPYGMQDSFGSQRLKFAIPELEVGDIYDYYYVEKLSGFMPLDVESSIFTFNDEDYPIVHQEYEWLLHKDILINIKVQNTDSPVTKTFYNKRGMLVPDEKKMAYYKVNVVHEESEMKKTERYNEEFRLFPTLEYRIKSKDKASKKSPYYTKRKSIYDNNIDKEKLAKYVREIYKENKFTQYEAITVIELLEGYDRELLRNSSRGDKDEKTEIYNELYAALRHYYYNKGDIITQYYDYNNSNLKLFKDNYDGDVNGAPNMYSYNESGYPNYEQTQIMAAILEAIHFNYEYFISVPRNYGDIDQSVMEEELYFGLKVYLSPDDFIYFSGFDRYTDPKDQDYNLEGAKILLVNPSGKKGLYKEDVFPISNYEDHYSTNEISVSYDVDSGYAHVEHQLTAVGRPKAYESKRNLFISDYFLSDWKKYDEDYLPYSRNLSMNARNSMEKEIVEKEKEREKYRLDLQKNYLEQDFSLVRLNNFEIDNNGREIGEPIQYSRSFVVDGLNSKAGDNIIIEIGRLIGGQVALQKKEYERRTPVFLRYPRYYRNEVAFEIPKGYYIDDYSDLLFDVNNEAGSYKTSVEIQENVLTYTTMKIYKANFLPQEKWDMMVEFLDSAYDFTQKKIVLKKKEEGS